jgi:hypothetical protein
VDRHHGLVDAAPGGRGRSAGVTARAARRGEVKSRFARGMVVMLGWLALLVLLGALWARLGW